MLRDYAVVLVVMLGLTQAVRAEEPFEAHSFKDAKGKELPYRLLKPVNYDPQQKYPCIIFFHGVGERGTDNISQLKNGIRSWATEENRKKFPCFIVAPQCFPGQQWVDTPWTLDHHTMPKEPTEAMRMAMELLAGLPKEYSIDTKRLYASGVSYGGFGAWDAITRYPDVFAACVPVCGGADEARAPLVAKLPIWAFHGDQDGVVKTIRSRNMIEAIKKAGGNPKYTEYKGVGHDSWNKAFAEPDVLPWLFEQKKS